MTLPTVQVSFKNKSTPISQKNKQQSPLKLREVRKIPRRGVKPSDVSLSHDTAALKKLYIPLSLFT